MAFKNTRFVSWSYSRYADYKQCPLKAKLAHLDKIREPKNAAMQRGADLHDQIRDFIRGTMNKVPAELTAIKLELSRFRKLFKKKLLGAIVEEDWAFTKDWTQTQWNDWANCVLRVKLDAAEWADNGETMIVTDWKSGKFREEMNEDYVEQLELYALAALVLHPQLQRIRPRLYYVDLGFVYPPISKPLEFGRKDVERLKKLWAKRTKPMLSDTRFAPRPNDKCRWCFYGQSGKIKGGPGLCKF